MKQILVISVVGLFIGLTIGAVTQPPDYPTEVEWQNKKENWSRYLEWEEQVEVRIKDGSRVDYLADDMAIEIDWASKWAEGVGQSLFYAAMTDRDPGIILLTKDRDRDRQRIRRCHYIAQKYGISVWVEEVLPER